MSRLNLKKIFSILLAGCFLFFIVACNGDSKASGNKTENTEISGNIKNDTNKKTENTAEKVESVDICRCLSEPGNTDWAKETRYICRDAISAKLGVENWEEVSLDPDVSEGFDKLVEDCGLGIDEDFEEVLEDIENTLNERVDGVYKYESSEGSFVITISGDTWMSEYMIVTGFGAAYDQQNAQYDFGIVYNGELYDDTGYVKLGYASDGMINFNGMYLYK
tara:strand:- start:34 stop:696 length:663 start_codon:yes stop_codon:yes gene_type:complete